MAEKFSKILKIHPKDNIVVALRDLMKGDIIKLVEDEYFRPHDTAVISVPQKAPDGATMRTESAFQLFRHRLRLR